MKVINSKKRVLLEVTQAHAVTDQKGIATIFYSYKGEISGYGPAEQVQRAFQTIKLDSPSATIEGTLPEPSCGGAR